MSECKWYVRYCKWDLRLIIFNVDWQITRIIKEMNIVTGNAKIIENKVWMMSGCLSIEM